MRATGASCCGAVRWRGSGGLRPPTSACLECALTFSAPCESLFASLCVVPRMRRYTAWPQMHGGFRSDLSKFRNTKHEVCSAQTGEGSTKFGPAELWAGFGQCGADSDQIWAGSTGCGLVSIYCGQWEARIRRFNCGVAQPGKLFARSARIPKLPKLSLSLSRLWPTNV